MIIPEDIIERLKLDFNSDFHNAHEMIKSSMNKYSDLRKERILRCIVFMSNGSLKKLETAIQIAKKDWRDAILNAEYKYVSGEKPKAVNDFRYGFNSIEE